ncbi:MAG: hypothetical protein GX859_02835 [Corynebacterium humireducens]|jgi:hypothetical protein|uniref:Anti-sigma-D factor RsdA sigma factor binding region domain-containing protein n=1 Tax=Corynebacterium humireducens TaxID=1223514 RepID=A0A7X6PLL3_9CORY|nr:hypothetical protein [Corynebacterium humireducens]
MKRRHPDATAGDITTQLKPLMDDDAFLTELSQGLDPSDGTDELAALFLELREDVEKQMPPAPLIEGADEEPVVISLAARRRARRGRPFVSGLIGAAAATLVIAGSGSMIYNATPGSPLWGMSSALFSDRAAVVELAGTLEEIDSRAAEGDIDGTRELLEEARRVVQNLRDAQSPTEQQTPREPGTTVTATTTATLPGETLAPEPVDPTTETVTETAHQTTTATVTVTQGPPPIRDNPLPNPVEPVPLPEPVDPVEPAPTVAPTLAPPQIQE